MKEYLEKTLRQNVLMEETERMGYHGLQFNPNVM